MIVCPNCQHHNADSAAQCQMCGESLAQAAYRVCTSCGALNPIKNHFCHRCLSQLVPTGSAAVEKPGSTGAGAPPSAGAEEPSDTADESPYARDAEQKPEVALPTFAQAPPQTGPFSREQPESFVEAGPGDEQTAIEPEERSAGLPELAGHPLEGITDALPLEASVALPHRGIPPAEQLPVAGERLQADLYRSLATAAAALAAEAQTVVPARQEGGLPKAGRLLLSLLVLLVALVPLVTPGVLQPDITPRESVEHLVSNLQSLGSDSRVLLSFDYGPSCAGELDPLAELIVQRLAAQSAKMVIMSTKPEGVGIARRILRQVSVQGDLLTYGQDYVMLGFLPGQESGLRYLLQSLGLAFRRDAVWHRSLSELEPTADISTAQDFDAIILLSDDSRTVRAWIEQGQQRITPDAIVTSRIEPVLIPYYEAGQLRTLVGGATGWIELGTLLDGARVPAGIHDGLAALFILVVLVAVVTNVIYISFGARAQR